MMINNELQKTLIYFQQNKPDLIHTFYNIIEILNKYKKHETVSPEAIKKLTIISKNIFIDFENIIPISIRRDETSELINFLTDISYIRPSFAQIIINNYPGINFKINKIYIETYNALNNSFIKSNKSEIIFNLCFNVKTLNEYLFMMQSFGNIIKNSPGITQELIETISSKFSKYPLQTFYKWLNRGADLLTSNRLEDGAAYLRLQSKEARDLLNLQYASLDDIKNIIRVYVSSLIGKEINILTHDFSSFNIKHSYTNGKTIFLPPLIDFLKKPEDNERIYTAIAAQISASISMETYNFNFEVIDFKQELSEKYGTKLPNIMDNVINEYKDRSVSIKNKRTGEIEVTFKNKRKLLILETPLEIFFYSFPTPDFIKELFTLIENSRLEYLLSVKYEGLKNDFKMLNEYLLKSRKTFEYKFKKQEKKLYLLIESLIQYSLAKKNSFIINDDNQKDINNRILNEFVKIFNNMSTSYDSAKIAFKIYNIFFENFSLVTFCRNHNIKQYFTELYKPVYYPEIILEESPELFNTVFNDYKPDESEDQNKDIDLTTFKIKDNEAGEIKKSILEGNLKIYRYPEYNYLKGSYQLKYCTLYERKLESSSNQKYLKILDYYTLIHKRLKKRFLYMQPEEIEFSRKWLDGEEINIDDSLDYLINIKRKQTADDKIYSKKIRNVRDIAVLILVDASSSTKELINLKSILNIEKEALSLLASSLETIGDSFAIYGFYSKGRKKVIVNIVKDFNEKWNDKTQGRIDSLKPYAANRDGCAIRHCINKLAMQPEKTKLLLLLSDGIPADIGYGSKSASETTEYSIEDTRKAVLEAKLKGIIPYCITIDKQARKYIPFLYGNYHYTIISDIEKLPEKLSKLYLRLTR